MQLVFWCDFLFNCDRSLLDFDFEKLCSVSLSHINCYACLVCGKYYQGRGQKSHAYTHSVQEGHHVYLNLETHKFYCLPDNYEIIDSSLSDILVSFRRLTEHSLDLDLRQNVFFERLKDFAKCKYKYLSLYTHWMIWYNFWCGSSWVSFLLMIYLF